MANGTSMRSGFRGIAVALTCALAILSGASDLAAQQTGQIRGRVIDEGTGQGLAVAQVYIPETGIGTLTDTEGYYTLRRVPAGTHQVVVQLLGYARKTVTGVQVEGRKTAELNVALPPQAIELEELTVNVQTERGNTAALLSERKKSAQVVDAIGSEQISRSPDGDAAAALKRVPGLSVVDGKYVYVRGLGERYGNTTLNGAPLPSPESDRKAIPLDIIPASFLESVSTAKTYLPDQPGDYAGGLVQIRTRRYPSFGLLKLSSSFEFNTESTFSDGLGYPGGDLDFFGFDDGTRELPGVVPSDRPVFPSSGLAAEDLERIGQAFDGAWGPGTDQLPVNQSYSLALGNETLIGDNPFGFFGSLTHSNKYKHRSDVIERVFAQSGLDDPEVDYDGEQTVHAVRLGGLFNAGYQLSETSEISLSAVYNRTVDDEARVLEGFNLDSNTDQRNTRIRYIAQTLLNTQLSGDHRLGWLHGSTLNWRLGYSNASRYEPNTREVLYRQVRDGRFLFDTFVQSGSIFHQDLSDRGFSGGLDLKVPMKIRSLPASLRFGGSAELRDRDAFTRRFRFLPMAALGDSVRALSPDELFSEENIAPDSFQIQEATFRGDNYDADQSVHAAYAMLDAEILPSLRFVGGTRLEVTEQGVYPKDLFPTPQEPLAPAQLDNTDLLPAVNLIYALSDEMNLRGGFSRTLARPQFRELAPFSFADFAGGYLVAGNPELERSLISNYDLRWEWFPRSGAVLAVSGFYKHFDAPIEALVFPSTEFIKTWVNVESARNLGAELEFRSQLDLIAPALSNLYFNLNVTLVESRIETGSSARVFVPGSGPIELAVVDEDRALQGQSPYVVNAGLTWFVPKWGTSATVLYNHFGRRIDAVGGQIIDEVYEEDRGQLDVVLKQPLWKTVELKISANRILGNEVEFTQGGDLLRAYDSGRSFSFSLTWGPNGL